ncbi:MAG: trehalose-6-phosphate synthase [Actinomycetota bacterium]|nr:trehalose-6-phosphate synthase [Actinomycetota bacterium]
MPALPLNASSTDPVALDEVLRGRSLVIASNRGPISYIETDKGDLTASRGAGGLVTALTDVMRHASGLWVASAMTPGDRRVVRENQDEHLQPLFEGEHLRLRYLTFDRDTFERYYNRISNSVFWFLHHSMWNLPLYPRFGADTARDWLCYQAVNRRFAQALAEEISGNENNAPVMLHDYHLMLTASYLRKLVPSAFSYHFTHSPWAQPDMMRVLPGRMAKETLEGMLANDLLGFQARRWSVNFMWCCREILGADVDFDAAVVTHRKMRTVIRDYPISIDTESVRALAHSEDAEVHLRWLDRMVKGRKLILRIDRMELSKNIVRGFRAYEHMLHNHPEWQGNVVHVALLYPSRRALSEYRSYEAEVYEAHDRINEQLGTDDWQPLVMINEDNYVRALACSRKYDVLMVNPILDGMNLVAKEGPAVNEVDGVLVLSQNAGAWYELGHGALGVNPYDVRAMAEALYEGLTMEPPEKAARSKVLREVIDRNSPSKWVWHQLNDITRLHES